MINGLNKNFYRKYNNPRVTVIIPVYNCQNTIVKTIRSIQNQKMTSIEILLVNDKSNNETVNIIQNIQKSDKRIKLINNKKNMGTLYSRNIGVLQAKGKYIFSLDNDDMFLDDDIINIIYEEAYNFNYDIVGFQAIKAYNYTARINQIENDIFIYKQNFTIKKPKLSLFGISKKGRLYIFDVRIWSKCIKKSIYKKAVNLLGKKRYSYFMSWNEDTSMVFVLFSVAKSYRYITRYGIFKLIRDNSASRAMPYSHKLFAEIFLLNVIFDFTKNDFKSKKFAFFMAIRIRNGQLFHSLNKINKSYLIF
jgi:glycosyltransferase involved in cell wall biosynthesis